MLNNILNMALEHMTSEVFISLDTYNIIKTFLFLLPKQGNASPNLHQAIKMAIVGYNELTFYKIGDIWVVVDASWDEAGTCHRVPPTRDQHDVDLLALER